MMLHIAITRVIDAAKLTRERSYSCTYQSSSLSISMNNLLNWFKDHSMSIRAVDIHSRDPGMILQSVTESLAPQK